MSLDETFQRWSEWATAQSAFIVDGEPGITEDEYALVASRLNAARPAYAKII
jgi:hypothetical protein